MLDFFEKVFNDPVGAITSVALGAFKGVGGKGEGTGAGSAAAAAQATELGFAKSTSASREIPSRTKIRSAYVCQRRKSKTAYKVRTSSFKHL